MESRVTLAEVESGKVELVKDGPVMFLQFNADCKDVLHICQAMCCRMRMAYNVELEAEEVERLKGVKHKQGDRELYVLPIKDQLTWDCTYLSDDAKCTVQEQKPNRCRDWHCSPKGNMNDELIKKRDKGWAMMPSTIRS